MADRIPCINPRCKRTADASKFGPGEEIVCAKCWKLVPIALKRRYKQLRRRDRKIDRLVLRKDSRSATPQKLMAMSGMIVRQFAFNWAEIKAIFQESEKPEGLDNFLEEAGLDG